MRRTAVPFVVVAALALMGLLVYGVLAVGESTTLDDAIARGERPAAPAKTLPKLGGGEASLADLRGKPVVLNFWASWCDPCKDEAPALQAAHERLRREGGMVLGVTVDDASPDAKAFSRELGLTFPSLRDVDGELGEAYGRLGVPETFAIDRGGRVAAVERGPVTAASLDAMLDEVLRR